jgi:thiamine-phosphate pyrophosphorylase
VSTRNNPPHSNPLSGRHSPLLCYVTDRRALAIADPTDSLAALTRKIEEVVAAGIDWVQIRERDLPARELASLARQTLAIAAKYSARRSSVIRVIVNDRLDVAIAERADGVHLGEKSLPAAEAMRFIAPAVRRQPIDELFLVGVSCHSIEAAQAAEQDGTDYIFFGPIFATPSKETFGPPQGVERLAQVCHTISIPVLAIGGITLQNAKSCMIAGAAGIAAIRLFQDEVGPSGVTQQLHQLVTACRHPAPEDRARPPRR